MEFMFLNVYDSGFHIICFSAVLTHENVNLGISVKKEILVQKSTISVHLAENKQRHLQKEDWEITNSESIIINFWIKVMTSSCGEVQAGIHFFCILCSAGGHKKWVTVRFPLCDSYHSCSLTVWFTPMKTLCNEKLSTLRNHKLDSFFPLVYFFPF